MGAATLVAGLLTAVLSPAADVVSRGPVEPSLAAVPASYSDPGSAVSGVLRAAAPMAAAPALGPAAIGGAAVTTGAAPTGLPAAVAAFPAATAPPGTSAALFTSAAPDARVRSAVDFALAQLGLPYVWGGNGPAAGDAGFDCSGLTTASYAAAGIALPRTAQTQYYAGPHVPPTAGLLPGDLVFYGVPGRVHHVGMYLGAGKMINAPTFGEPVQVAYVRYPGDDYLGATRPAYGGAVLVPGYLPAIPAPGAGSAPRPPSTVFEAPAAPAPTPQEVRAAVVAVAPQPAVAVLAPAGPSVVTDAGAPVQGTPGSDAAGVGPLPSPPTATVAPTSSAAPTSPPPATSTLPAAPAPPASPASPPPAAPAAPAAPAVPASPASPAAPAVPAAPAAPAAPAPSTSPKPAPKLAPKPPAPKPAPLPPAPLAPVPKAAPLPPVPLPTPAPSKPVATTVPPPPGVAGPTAAGG